MENITTTEIQKWVDILLEKNKKEEFRLGVTTLGDDTIKVMYTDCVRAFSKVYVGKCPKEYDGQITGGLKYSDITKSKNLLEIVKGKLIGGYEQGVKNLLATLHSLKNLDKSDWDAILVLSQSDLREIQKFNFQKMYTEFNVVSSFKDTKDGAVFGIDRLDPNNFEVTAEIEIPFSKVTVNNTRLFENYINISFRFLNLIENLKITDTNDYVIGVQDSRILVLNPNDYISDVCTISVQSHFRKLALKKLEKEPNLD